jgi:3-hydroxybutyryl-CoA dehydrogenase
MTVRKITVIGAGSMGHQIAMLAALGGYETWLQDINESVLIKAEDSVKTLFQKWVEKGKMTEHQLADVLSRLTFTNDLKTAVENSDFIIEAIVEKLELKRALFQQLDAIAPPHAILATNSSTIVNSKIASVTQRPSQVVNMHFFFPPLVMDCVEVAMSEETSKETADLTMEVCKRMNRTSFLLKKEISGFIANRILGAIQREAMSLYEQGIADYQDIDLICKKALNHPLGPFEISDLSGVDVILYVMEQQYRESGDESLKPPQFLIEKVQSGELGRKVGKGFYEYSKPNGK